jgi:hypothetical protein
MLLSSSQLGNKQNHKIVGGRCPNNIADRLLIWSQTAERDEAQATLPLETNLSIPDATGLYPNTSAEAAYTGTVL